jgi:hypothetical protein
MNKGRKKVGRVPTEKDRKQAVDLLINRLNQAFAIYFWMKTVRPMLATHSGFKNRNFEIETVQNACLQSTLMCIRDLDDFFTTKDKTWESDVRAKDFIGYKSTGSFLTDEERRKIHQWIVHLTYEGIWTGTTGIAPGGNLYWNPKYLFGKMINRASGFLDFLVRVYFKDCAEEAEKVQNIKKGFEHRIESMKKLT